MKSWCVKREDGTYLLARNGCLRLFPKRGDAKDVADKTKGKAKAQRCEIADA